MGDDYDDDGYDYERRYRGRRPSPRRNVSDLRRSHHFLDPNMIDGGGLYRTRSQGHAPLPIVNTYVDVINDNNQRSPSPYPPYPPSPDYRDRRRDNRLGDVVDAIEDLTVETRRAGRSRSRGLSDVGQIERREDYYDWERRRRSEEERLKERLDLERRKSEEEEKDRKKRIIDDYEKKKREESEERKEEEKRLRQKIKQDEIDKKEKEEREWKEFLQKQKQEEEGKEEKKKKKDEEIDEALRERLYNMGWSKARVDMEIERERVKRKTTTTTTTTTISGGALVPLYPANQAPTYAKVKREHIAIETLKYYGIPWEYDRKDKRYIIILREMTESETDALFEHTKQLKEKSLPMLLEPPKDKPQYALYRKRDRSTSRVRKAGILKYVD